MAQSMATATRDEVDTAIRETVQDYIEAWGDGDPARMERSLHPELAKRIVRANSSLTSSWQPGDWQDEVSALRLAQLARHPPIPEYTRGMSVTLLDRFANVASVKIGRDEPWDWEYAHLANWNGRWVIVNVLWGLRPNGTDEQDVAAISRTAQDYIEACYEADPAKMERSLHPHLAKRIVRRNDSSAAFWWSGDYLGQMSAQTLVQKVRSWDPAPLDRRRVEITILDRFENGASVRTDASTWMDYLHLAKWNGRWVILNVLWDVLPKF